MAIEITKYGVGARDLLGAQDGDVVTVADGAVSDPFSGSGFYRIIATSACRVRIGPEGIADATGGETWPENQVEVRSIPDGYEVACDALS